MSNVEPKDESAPATDAEQVAKCEKCDRPAAHRSRFCEAHRGSATPTLTAPTAPKQRRLDIVIGVILSVVFAVWLYPRFMHNQGKTTASNGDSEGNKPIEKSSTVAKPNSTASALKNKDEPVAAKVGTKQESRPVLPIAPAGTRSLVTGANTCGNGVVDLGEQCDGQALGEATCASLGFSGDCGPEEGCIRPGLTCLASCMFDYSGCTAESQAASQRFMEAGDGTAIDRLTGLTWELKCSEGPCAETHSVLASLPWAGAASQWISSLNAEKFAGHSDWRLPSLEELRSLLAAVPPCPAEPCSKSAWPRKLTATAGYWSSTTFSVDKRRAWAVSFRDGDVYTAEKSEALHVRAVRSGS
ncbi:MAG: DUF1566 domain-containing protein [Deltaproteobacteria bacterium]|nr:DUF1566 domain-containing protein [Deltaproteobacteria bacterium]